MIALMIFGMIAAAGVALLSFSVKAQRAGGAALDDAGALNRTASILTADLAQAQDRPTRDVVGTLLPAMTGGSGFDPALRLVRAGWSNPDEVARPTLQKVEYRLNAGGLSGSPIPSWMAPRRCPPRCCSIASNGCAGGFAIRARGPTAGRATTAPRCRRPPR